MTTLGEFPYLHAAQPWLGGFVDISVKHPGVPTGEALAAVDAAFAEVRRLHHLLGFFVPGSNVQELNALEVGGRMKVHPDTYDLLVMAEEFERVSRGVFCINVADASLGAGGVSPGMSVWRFPFAMMERPYVRRRLPGRVDLGGFAKGFVVDRALDVLRGRVGAAMVDSGGDVAVFGGAFPINIPHPGDPARRLAMPDLVDGAQAVTSHVVGSMASRAFYIIDPRVGAPHPFHGTMVVRSTRCVVADALTKVMLLSESSNMAREILGRFRASAVFHTPEGRSWEYLPEIDVEESLPA